MVTDAKRISYANHEPSLRERMPECLKHTQSMRSPFEEANDPSLKLQKAAMTRTEAQRREEAGNGSLMVKLQKPMPSLRPKNHQAVLRQHFNQDWVREQRRAAMAHMENEPKPTTEAPVNQPVISR